MNIIEEFKQWKSKLIDTFYSNGEFKTKAITVNKLKKDFPEMYELIQSKYDGRHREILYCIFNDIPEIPKCPLCGKETPLRNFVIGFQVYCSKECATYGNAHHSEESIQKIRESHIKYNKENCKNIFVLKYNAMLGSESGLTDNWYRFPNYCKHGDIDISRTVADKIYSLYPDNPCFCYKCNEELFLSYQPTDDEILSFQNNFHEFFKEHNHAVRYDFWITYYPKYLKCITEYFNRHIRQITYPIDKNDLPEMYYVFEHKLVSPVTCAHRGCSTFVKFNRPSNSYLTFCHTHKKCSLVEEQMMDYIDNNIPEKAIYHDRTQFIDDNSHKQIELDTYIPNLKLAIEFNGTFYHSSKMKSMYAQFDKFKMSADKNIRLYSIWEDDWNYRQTQCKDFIFRICGQHMQISHITSISNIDIDTTISFFNKNYITIQKKFDRSAGIYSNKELIGILTFIKVSDNVYHINQDCLKLGITVDDNLYNCFISYQIYNNISIPNAVVDNDIYISDFYKKLGFDTLYPIIDRDWLYGAYLTKTGNINIRSYEYNTNGICYNSGYSLLSINK